MTDKEKNQLAKDIAIKNAQCTKLTNEVKALKIQAQAEFKVGDTVLEAALITIKEIHKNQFNSANFKLNYPILHDAYCLPTSYKTVSSRLITREQA